MTAVWKLLLQSHSILDKTGRNVAVRQSARPRDLGGALELATKTCYTRSSAADGNQADLGAFMLKCAAEEGSYDLCMELLNLNVSANVQDEDGNSPLHIAAKCNNMGFARALCEQGCDVMARNKHNRTPKMLV
jgi:ankyrin repeat protein